MIHKQTRITNSEKFLNQKCEYFATFGLNLSKKFTENQLLNFKIYATASLQSFMLLDVVENEVAAQVIISKQILLQTLWHFSKIY